MAIFGPPTRICRRPIVSIYHMTAGAAGRAIIPGMVIGPHETEQRIVQAGFLDVEKNRIDATKRAETPIGSAAHRPSGRLRRVRIPDLRRAVATLLENAQDI